MIFFVLTIALLTPTTYQVDIIDYNHVVNEKTREIVLEQVILWKWIFVPKYGWDYYVMDWKLKKEVGRAERVNGLYRLKFGNKVIISKMNQESFTSTDVELDNQTKLSVSQRKLLWP